jgi:hypothetical protein
VRVERFAKLAEHQPMRAQEGRPPPQEDDRLRQFTEYCSHNRVTAQDCSLFPDFRSFSCPAVVW